MWKNRSVGKLRDKEGQGYDLRDCCYRFPLER